MNLNYLFWDEIFPYSFIMEDPESKSEAIEVTFLRDDNYDLLCDVKAIGETNKKFLNKLYAEESNLVVKCKHGGSTAELQGIFFNQRSWDGKEMKMKGVVSKIILNHTINKSAETKTIIYWFLSNVKNANIEFSRVSKFKTSGKAELEIQEILKDVIEIPVLKESIGRNVIALELNDKKFCFGIVAEEYMSKDYKGIFLRFDNRVTPTEEEIKTITNFLSFIFGAIIIPVGCIRFWR